MNRTFSPKRADVEREQRWHLVDADGVVFGRLCTELARLLTGKHKPIYAQHVDTGDYVVVVNAARIVLTGAKPGDKVYYRHSTKPGTLKAETAGNLLQRDPRKLLELGVRRMLPKNRLGRRQLKKLKVYAGPEHRHEAQQPEPYELGGRKTA